jgi:hypothetical protein
VTINSGGMLDIDANMVAVIGPDVMVAIDPGRVTTRVAADNSEPQSEGLVVIRP